MNYGCIAHMFVLRSGFHNGRGMDEKLRGGKGPRDRTVRWVCDYSVLHLDS